MKQRRQVKLFGFCFLLSILFYFTGRSEKINVNEIDINKIEDFDLIISKGQSAQSKLIRLLNFSIDDYSHVGILMKDNEQLYVLHATPDGSKINGIRYDDLQTFIDLSNVSECTVIRCNALSDESYIKLKSEFETYKNSQVPFDYDFDNFDDKNIYCSELISIIFNNSGLSIFSEIDMTKPIYPKYFLKTKCFFVVE
ncbi:MULTISPECIES: YiiX/YebB-like N1pC/P60 family cysteine hydrolase [unclassified Carboxylicivirga]|uniref:YiiX/YebB-like N1pC/P60 family cysteine hydrolase n=1 Tax=Carboxylicivirga TaxID=1628153 RepID=UPI003D32CFB6